MKHYRPRKYRGPETWALAREAYLAGEPGPSIARRLDVGLANLRKKALIEGWTRRAHAEALEARTERAAGQVAESTAEAPPFGAEPTAAAPADPVAAAVALASSQLLAGRAAEAAATLKAAEVLARLTGRTAPAASHPEPANDEPVFTPLPPLDPEKALAFSMTTMGPLWERVEAYALEVLSDTVNVPSGLSAFAYRWRAEHLGPEVAARDREHGMSHGWGARYWDEEGRLRTPEAVFRETW